MKLEAAMLDSRRRFIQTAGLAAGVVALGCLPLTASGPVVSVAERQVAEVISRYGDCVRVSRTDGGATEFRVQMRSHGHFVKVFDPRCLPFERIRVGPGNTLDFNYHGSEFRIVNIG